MNKLKKVLVLAVITLFVVVIGFVFVQSKSDLDVDNKLVINNDNSVDEEENQVEKDQCSDDTPELVIEQSNQEEQKVEQPKEDSKQEEKKSSSSSNKKTETKPKVENKKEESTVVTKPAQEEKNNPWDVIGITEDEYYHSPQFKWQKVTHKDLNSCQIEGNDKIGNQSNEYTQFWCYEVSSYSGSRLGYMLELS